MRRPSASGRDRWNRGRSNDSNDSRNLCQVTCRNACPAAESAHASRTTTRLPRCSPPHHRSGHRAATDLSHRCRSHRLPRPDRDRGRRSRLRRVRLVPDAQSRPHAASQRERILGDDHFVEEVLSQLEAKPGAASEPDSTDEMDTRLASIAARHRVDESLIASPSKQPRAVLARGAFCDQAQRDGHWPAARVAAFLDISPMSVHRAVRKQAALRSDIP